MTFFDPSNPSDLSLLHSSVRDHDELYDVADKVEYEVLDRYRQRDMERVSTYEAFFEYEFGRDPNDEIKVRLVGYDAETPEDSEAGLKEALRRTIAEVVSWVLRNYDTQSDVSSIQQGQRSITYSGNAPTWESFPDGWDRYLKNYDASIKSYGI